MVKFGDVVKNVTEAERDPLGAGIERYLGLEHIEPENLHITSWGLVEDGTTFTRKFRKGQVLFAKRRAYQRKAAVAEFDGVCSSDILTLEPKGDDLIPELLPFIVQSDGFFDHALGTSAGSLSPRTRWSQLRDYEFPLPPKDEQRRIAEILWAADEAQEAYRLASARAVGVRRAIWDSFNESGDYDTVELGSIAEIGNGSTPSRKHEGYWQNGVFPWLSSGKIRDRVVVEADEYISGEAVERYASCIFPAGSVLVAMIGQGTTRGMAAYLTLDACINQNLAAIVPSDAIDGWYLFYCLDSSYERLRAWSHGSNQGALNCELLRHFPVPLPSLARQVELACILRSVDAAADHTRSHANKLAELAAGVGADLLKATVTAP